MDIQKFKSLSKKDREKFLSTYDEQKLPHSERITQLENELDELTSSNSAQIEERNKAKKACSWTVFVIIAAVLAAIGLYSLSLISIVFFVAAVALIVVKFLMYKKNKPILDKLNGDLAEYDATCEQKKKQIAEENSEIAKISEAGEKYVSAHRSIANEVVNRLSDIAYRERYFNTLAIYIGSRYVETYAEVENESVHDWDLYVSSELGDTAVCIDGKAYTIPMIFDNRNLRRDCILFHLEPGVHTVSLASCPALDPYSDPPLFTDPVASSLFTVTIDENTPFVGIAAGISYTMDKGGARSVNKTFVTNSQSEFLKTVGTKFPYSPEAQEFDHYFKDDENELVTLEKILKEYKTPEPKKLKVFTGSYIITGLGKDFSSPEVKNLPWSEYKSAHVFGCLLNIDGCIYPMEFANSIKADGGDIPRQYYNFTIGAGQHSFNLTASVLLSPRVLVGGEKISNTFTTDTDFFTVERDDDFAGLAIGFVSDYVPDNRIIGSFVDNQGGYQIVLNKIHYDNDEARFMTDVAL